MVVIIENDPGVPPGILRELLLERGIPFRLVRPYAGELLPEPGEAAAAVVLGGTMGVGDTGRHPFLVEVKEFIRECVALRTPFLGICLGGQLLAEVLGAPVTPKSRGEKGTCRVTLTPEGSVDPLYRGVPREFLTFQWHDDSFELPPGCAHLAASPACNRQAFRYGSSSYGVQFHPEVDRTIVAAWSGNEAEHAGYLRDFVRSEAGCRAASRMILGNFLYLAGLAGPCPGSNGGSL